MSSEVKSDGKEVTVETSTPTPEGQHHSLMRIPILGNIKDLANIYLAIGASGLIVVVFLFIYVRNSAETSHLYQAAMLQQGESQANQIEKLIAEIKDTRQQHREDMEKLAENHRKDLEKATDRYLASREVAEKRHLETLAAINKMELSNGKTNLFLEQLAAWFAKESKRPVGAAASPPPKPEM